MLHGQRMEPIFFESPAAWRAWLEANHETATEVLFGFWKKGTGRPSLTWPQSVDEALCFGWIDGIRRSIDDKAYTIRFTPRKKTSTWSAVNIRRVAELTAEGRMRPAGLRAFEARDPAKSEIYSYENALAALAPAFESRFREDAAAWDWFQAQPPWYRRISTGWVMTAKQEATRVRRLETLIADSAAGRRIRAVLPSRADREAAQSGGGA
jgi:uncharacterized protein YdeI (YjbR/CyaY-like superfamily)